MHKDSYQIIFESLHDSLLHHENFLSIFAHDSLLSSAGLYHYYYYILAKVFNTKNKKVFQE